MLELTDGAIGFFADPADAADHVPTVGLLRVVTAKGHADERLARQGADEAIALPLREQLAVIDQQAGGRDDRIPEQLRRYEIRPARMWRDRHAIIVPPLRNQRPTVIPARRDQVELVAAPRAHFALPQSPPCVEGEAVGVPMSASPGLR